MGYAQRRAERDDQLERVKLNVGPGVAEAAGAPSDILIEPRSAAMPV
jgi:hypothetical protein